MTLEALAPRLVTPTEAAVYDQMRGEKIHVLLSGGDTGGTLALFVDEVPPGGGPPLHVHQREDETFYVLEGELEVRVADERFSATAGSALFLPRGIPHGFANHGSQTARVLVAVTPGGLEGFFAAVEPLVTQAEPDMAAVAAVAGRYGVEIAGPPLGKSAGDARRVEMSRWAVRPDEAPAYGIPGGETVRVLLDSERTGGRLALLHGEFYPGDGAPLHRHRREDETFYVLEGALDLWGGEGRERATAGAAAFRPREVPHDFWNHEGEVARAVAIVTPGGFEKYFAEVYALIGDGEPDEEAMRALTQRFGLEAGQ